MFYRHILDDISVFHFIFNIYQVTNQCEDYVTSLH